MTTREQKVMRRAENCHKKGETRSENKESSGKPKGKSMMSGCKSRRERRSPACRSRSDSCVCLSIHRAFRKLFDGKRKTSGARDSRFPIDCLLNPLEGRKNVIKKL